MTESRSILLLGPQGPARTAGRALADLGIRGRVALVTAGWQERESEDKALVADLGVPAVNLRLHARAEEIFAKDPELRTAYQARQMLLRHMQDFYRLRLDYADEAAHAIAVRHVEPELIEQEWEVSLESLRALDADHLLRCRDVHAAFEERCRPTERPAVSRHVHAIRARLNDCAAVVIAGGHVASLVNRMRLLDVLGQAGDLPLIAWSAGAMALTERIVLFHDFPPYGKDLAQVLEDGFGCARGVVVMPDASRRVRLDDRPGITRFARRMAPLACLTLDPGGRLVFTGGELAHAEVDRLAPSGEVERAWRG